MTIASHTSFYAMATRCNVVLPGIPDEEAEAVFRHIQYEIGRVEQKLSRFQGDSDIARINQHPAGTPCPADDEMMDILRRIQQYSERTGGCFDITLRPVLQHWHDHPEGTLDQSLDVLKKLGMHQIELDFPTSTVTRKNDTVDLDLGGFGKGYALERVQQMLARFGIRDAFITFGESSVLTLGAHPAGDCWKVGVKDYRQAEASAHTFSVNTGSVSTSSNFYVDDAGNLVNHRHVIYPHSGRPVEELVTVSVCAASAVDAEVLSTAMLVMDEEQIQEVADHFPGIEIVKVDYSQEPYALKVWVAEPKPTS